MKRCHASGVGAFRIRSSKLGCVVNMGAIPTREGNAGECRPARPPSSRRQAVRRPYFAFPNCSSAALRNAPWLLPPSPGKPACCTMNTVISPRFGSIVMFVA